MIPLPPATTTSIQLFLKTIKAKSAKLIASKSSHYDFDFINDKPLARSKRIAWEKLPKRDRVIPLKGKRTRVEASAVEHGASLDISLPSNNGDKKEEKGINRFKRKKEEVSD